jgi:hypothetical protein
MRSWQGSQIPPLSIGAGLAQIMHFFFSSLINNYLTQTARIAKPSAEIIDTPNKSQEIL